ncbi:MAG: hypothetical protein H6711_17275 [Myxococcales bacterium]|nr:hypothetical protein [Myxococcales bacterium]
MSLLTWPASSASASAPTAADEVAALRPERALLTPAWIASLAALGINDHLLKGAGVLPDLLTGKLSDFAGMMVAPALLAALTRTSSRRGLFLCHLAVGAVFAAINLSHEAASIWSGLMGMVAFPWKITVDPTDLVALPALALSWRVLAPSMSKPVPRGSLRALEGSLACAGVCLSVATSPPEEDWTDDDWWSNPVSADVYVQNVTNEDVVVRLRRPHADAELDCFEVAVDPGRYLSEAVFGEAEAWTLAPGNMVAAEQEGIVRDCHAVLVEGDAFPQTLLFWQNGAYPEVWHDGAAAEEGGVIISEAEGEEGLSIDSPKSPELLFALADLEDRPADACALQEDGDRLAWTSLTRDDVQIAGIDVGPDGCIGLDFGDAPDAVTDWYVCMPPALFPFQVGDWIRGEVLGQHLNVRKIAGPGQEPLVDFAELYLSAGESLPVLVDTTFGVRGEFGCEPAPDACGTVARPISLTAKRGQLATATLELGQTLTLDDGDSKLDLHLVHGEERILVNSACSEGPSWTGNDIEMVAVYTGAL